jgi:hypothetical protein
MLEPMRSQSADQPSAAGTRRNGKKEPMSRSFGKPRRRRKKVSMGADNNR